MEKNQDQSQASIPNSVTLGGVTYPISETPELQQLIQSVASVEKSKLHSTFDGLKKQIEELKGIQLSPDGQQPLDLAKIVNTLKTELASSFVSKNDLKAELQEVVQPLLKSTQEAREKELAEYRQELINKNLDSCIPELVEGKNREEIDASLKKSIEIRAKYPSANVPYQAPGHVTDPNLARQANQPEFKAQSPTAPVISEPRNQVQKPQAPQVPPMQQQPDGYQQPASAKTLSMEEFAKKRETMLHELQSAYGN